MTVVKQVSLRSLGFTVSRLGTKVGLESARRTLRGVARGMPRKAKTIARKMQPVPRATGKYLRSFGWEPTKVGAIVYNSAPHAIFIERGRRAGARQPPVKPILRWMRVKKIRGGRATAWRISRAIARRGIPAKPVISRTFDVAVERVKERLKRRIEKGMTS